MAIIRTDVGVGLALGLVAGTLRPAKVNSVTMNPGAKFGYTFGRGWTWGFEYKGSSGGHHHWDD
jgi:hypothetical protein